MNLESFGAGWLIYPKSRAQVPGVYFVFHHDKAGTLAVDIATPHPHIAYKGFSAVLNVQDIKSEDEKIVMLGGDTRPDDALVILHDTSALSDDSHRINDDFSFLSFNYVLIPGSPPRIETPASQPTKITFRKPAHFLTIMGFRMWEGDALAQQIQSGIWMALPATKDIVFHTPYRQRLERLRRVVN